MIPTMHRRATLKEPSLATMARRHGQDSGNLALVWCALIIAFVVAETDARWIHPDDPQTCAGAGAQPNSGSVFASFGHCCKCNACPSRNNASLLSPRAPTGGASPPGASVYSSSASGAGTGASFWKTPVELLTFFSAPFPATWENVGTSMCANYHGTYIMSSTDPDWFAELDNAQISTSQTIGPGTQTSPTMHMTQQVFSGGGSGGATSRGQSRSFQIYHEGVPGNYDQGRWLYCYDEHFVSFSRPSNVVQLFVRTSNPSWSLLSTLAVADIPGNYSAYASPLSPPGSSARDANSNGGGPPYDSAQIALGPNQLAAYSKETKTLFIADVVLQRVISVNPYKSNQVQAIYEAPDSRAVFAGTLETCFPFLFVCYSYGSIHVYESGGSGTLGTVGGDGGAWSLKQIIHSHRKIGSSIQCTTGGFMVTNVLSDSETFIESVLVYSNTYPPAAAASATTTPDRSSYSYAAGAGTPDDQWGLVQEIRDPLPNSYKEPTFGWSFDVVSYHLSAQDSGVRLAISDPFKDISSSAKGAVYLYEYTGRAFEFCQEFTDGAMTFQTLFGYKIVLTHDMLLVDVPNALNDFNFYGEQYGYALGRAPCMGCDAILNSCAAPDVCGVCNGNNTRCTGCDGIPYSGKVMDSCAICDGKDSTCLSVFSASNIIEVSCSTMNAFTCYISVPMVESMKAQSLGNTKIDLVLSSSAAGGASGSGASNYSAAAAPASMCGTFLIDTYRQIPASQLPAQWIIQCGANCAYFIANLVYQTSAQCVDNAMMATMMPLEAQLFFSARKNQKLMFKPSKIDVEINYVGCVDCRQTRVNSPSEAWKLDQCFECGGNGSSCLDCNQVAFGDNFVDYCMKCVPEDKANRSCIYASPVTSGLSAFNATQQAIVVSCKHSVSMDPFMNIQPVAIGRNPRFELKGKSVCGDASVKYLSNVFSFSHRGVRDCNETLLVRVSDNWKNQIMVPVFLSVQGCHVVGCDGVLGSGKKYDLCGACDGSNACVDCLGVAYGAAQVDACGVCGGDSSSCGDMQQQFNQAVTLNQIALIQIQQQQDELAANDDAGGNANPTWQYLLLFGIPVLSCLVILFVGGIIAAGLTRGKRSEYNDLSLLAKSDRRNSHRY